jgi:hypothetical protein
LPRPSFRAGFNISRISAERRYILNVTGDCNPAKLRTHFRGLEGLKKGAGGAEIISVCRQIALEEGRHGKTIGKDLVAVEMDRTGHNHCSHYSEDGAEVILVPDIF